MLIIPVFRSTDTKNPSYACLAIILINLTVFFFIQSDDTKIHEEAYSFYHSSGLDLLEVKAYRDYLLTKGEDPAELSIEDSSRRNQLTRAMFADQEYIRLLTQNLIISPGHPDFNEWREKRDQFEAIKQRAVTDAYGYSPLQKNYIGLFTCMFLHGGLMHLAGNMVFLWLVGAILEKAIGPGLFILLYCISGVCGSLLFGLANPLSPGPLIGASGAISGLMGAYGVIFSLRNIRVFYSLGFYFNYANIPAITLFPIWLGNEFFQLFTNHGSRVAYMAHIGGLLSGVTIGACYRFFCKNRIEALFVEQERADKLEALLESAMDKLVALDLQQARKDYSKVLELDPENPQLRPGNCLR